MRTRVKICGITRVADGLAAARAGADAVGLVFHPPSPRAVSPAQAREIADALPPFVTRVGLFVDAAPERVAEVVATVGLDLVQFHGDEAPADCARCGRPWIKAVRMRADLDLGAIGDRYRDAAMLLLDAYRPGTPGGTGERFDWDRIPPEMAPGIILAGGLTPANVADAVRRIGPYAVDVSGGVEQAPGIKDTQRINAFIEGVQLGDER